jgi:hypothetical protein
MLAQSSAYFVAVNGAILHAATDSSHLLSASFELNKWGRENPVPLSKVGNRRREAHQIETDILFVFIISCDW